MNYTEITNREELLIKYSSDHSILKSIIEKLPEDAIDFVPDIEGAWSIREHYAHLTDTEIRAFLRYSNAILDPGVELRLGGGNVNTNQRYLKF